MRIKATPLPVQTCKYNIKTNGLIFSSIVRLFSVLLIYLLYSLHVQKHTNKRIHRYIQRDLVDPTRVIAVEIPTVNWWYAYLNIYSIWVAYNNDLMQYWVLLC